MKHSLSERLRNLVAWSTIAFPVFMLVGFALHPHLLSWELVHTADQLALKFHNSLSFHFGHLLVLMAVPLIIANLVFWMGSLEGVGRRYIFWGGIIGVLGAVLLAVDKGALCLVLSGFDTLPEAQFQNFVPSLQVIIDRAGLLKLVWLLPLLPLGAILQAIGLCKEDRITVWQAGFIVTGLLLLNNPDIGIISCVAGVSICIGYIPVGVALLRQGALSRSVS